MNAARYHAPPGEGFENARRPIAKTQATQKQYAKVATDLVKAQDAAKAALVPDAAWAKLEAGLLTAVRAARDELAAGYADQAYQPGAAVEVELRLGQYVSRHSGLRFDFGRGPHAMPPTVDGTVREVRFKAGVAENDFQVTSNPARRLRRHPPAPILHPPARGLEVVPLAAGDPPEAPDCRSAGPNVLNAPTLPPPPPLLGVPAAAEGAARRGRSPRRAADSGRAAAGGDLHLRDGPARGRPADHCARRQPARRRRGGRWRRPAAGSSATSDRLRELAHLSPCGVAAAVAVCGLRRLAVASAAAAAAVAQTKEGLPHLSCPIFLPDCPYDARLAVGIEAPATKVPSRLPEGWVRKRTRNRWRCPPHKAPQPPPPPPPPPPLLLPPPPPGNPSAHAAGPSGRRQHG